MKKFIAYILLGLFALSSVGLSAQTFTFTTGSNPGLTVSTNPYGTGVGVSTPYFNTVYTSDGYYGGHRHHHKRHHRRHHRPAPRNYRSRAHYKAAKKARKEYRKEYKKQMKKAYKRHHRHHDD